MKEYVFGIDIGGTTVKIGFFNKNGDLLDKWEIKTNIQDNGKYLLEDIADALDKKLKAEHLSKEDIISVGMGVPGPVIDNSIVNHCVNIGLGRINIAEEFYKLTNLKTKVSNDANLAALGEMYKGGGTGYKNLVFVTLGTGIGAGIIINGNIVNGANGASGEIGSIIVVDDEKESCSCGKPGCVEQYASANGLVRVAKRKLKEKHIETTLEKYNELTAKDICDEAKKGDIIACDCLKYSMSLLGKALASVASVCDPEIFIIGGGLSKAGDILIDYMKESYKHYAFHACEDALFKLATLGNDAGIYGAFKLLIG